MSHNSRIPFSRSRGALLDRSSRIFNAILSPSFVSLLARPIQTARGPQRILQLGLHERLTQTVLSHTVPRDIFEVCTFSNEVAEVVSHQRLEAISPHREFDLFFCSFPLLFLPTPEIKQFFRLLLPLASESSLLLTPQIYGLRTGLGRWGSAFQQDSLIESVKLLEEIEKASLIDCRWALSRGVPLGVTTFFLPRLRDAAKEAFSNYSNEEDRFEDQAALKQVVAA